MSDLEGKINKKKFSFTFKDFKWFIAIIVTIVGWSVTAYLWVSDKSKMKEEIVTLKNENETLKGKVIKLEGQIGGVNNAAQIFMQNSPSENRYRIEKLERDVEILKKPGEADPQDFKITPIVNIDSSIVNERESPSTNLDVNN